MLTADQKEQVLRDLEDPSFRREFFGRFMGRDDWRVQWDGLSTGALKMLSNTFPGEFSVEQLLYFANRHAAAIRSSYVPRTQKPKQESPKIVYVYVIYWLVREYARDIPLYVGMTRQLSERWTAHRNGGCETKGLDDLQSLRITVVETVCGKEKDARNAEARHIKAAALLNVNLLNKVGK